MNEVGKHANRMGLEGIHAAARADFLQRVRSFRFLVVLMATIALGMLMLPTQEAGYVVLKVGESRGLYGSAWVGLVFGVIAATVLPLLGFFVIKDALARDRETRVGLVLAASPLSRFGYLGAKLLSNLAIFLAILAVSSVVAFGMQLWRAEDTAFHPLDLLVHLWLVPLPVLLMTSAVALLFECVPVLRGAFGNVVFFFLWAFAFGPSMMLLETDKTRIVTRRADFYGISAPLAHFEDHLSPDARREGGLSIGANIGGAPPTPVPWAGIAHDGRWILDRALWMLAFVPVLLLAAPFFDRFDPARGGKRPGERELASAPVEREPAQMPWHVLTPLPKFASGWRPLTLLLAELTLMLKRRPMWWYAIVLGLWVAGVATDPVIAVKWIVPIAWLWGLTTFSEHGARAEIHETRSLLDSAPSPLLRQLPVQWLAGSLVALILVAPLLAKLFLLGATGIAAQVLVGAGFVAALALALGALSGGPRLFELAFLMLWYIAMQDAAPARFTGNPDLAFAASYAPIYLAIAAALFAGAWLMRLGSMRR